MKKVGNPLIFFPDSHFSFSLLEYSGYDEFSVYPASHSLYTFISEEFMIIQGGAKVGSQLFIWKITQ